MRTGCNVGRRAAAAATWAFLAAISVTPALAATPPAGCDVADVTANALPSVVNIWDARVLPAEDAHAKAGGRYRLEFFVGTGFVVDPSGVIVTNKHVIQDAAMIRITFHNGEQVPARLIAASSMIDVALLKVDVGHPLPVLRFADSDRVQPGQPVTAIGNPLGLGTSISAGVISGEGRDLMKTPIDEFIQTDASINPGNSGGPLIGCDGKVVGVNTALMSNSSVLGSIGIGFALPANDVAIAAHKIMHPFDAHPDWVGLELQDLSPTLAESFGDHATHGAIVTAIDHGSPAEHAGLKLGDIITAIGGRAAPNARVVQRSIVVTPPGVPINLSVWRRGQTHDVSMRGVDWPHMAALRGSILASAEAVASVHKEGTGMSLANITDTLRKRFGLAETSGVVIDHVTDGTEADSMGLAAGDVIKMVDDQPATSVNVVNEHFDHAAAARGYLVPILVQSKARTRWVTVYFCHVNVADLVVPEPVPSSVAERSAGQSAGRPARTSSVAAPSTQTPAGETPAGASPASAAVPHK